MIYEMIEKFIEEMAKVRLIRDYKNYRTLSGIVTDYIGLKFPTDDYRYHYVPEKITQEEKNKIKTMRNKIQNEIVATNELMDINLIDKNYSNLKILSQVDIILKRSMARMDNYLSNI